MENHTRELAIHPLTPERWDDLESLFGPRGATGGCWCMWWRLKRSEYDKMKGEGNRLALKSLVDAREIPGLLGYIHGRPAAWCSIGPREAYPVLDRSPVLKRVDDWPVWSVVCFFVGKDYRRQGVTTRMLRGALDYARQRGAKIVEGYPVEPKKDEVPEIFAFTGIVPLFQKVGFVEVARRSPTRPIMRYYLEDGS